MLAIRLDMPSGVVRKTVTCEQSAIQRVMRRQTQSNVGQAESESRKRRDRLFYIN